MKPFNASWACPKCGYKKFEPTYATKRQATIEELDAEGAGPFPADFLRLRCGRCGFKDTMECRDATRARGQLPL